MLAQPLRLGEVVEPTPAAAWWGGTVWLAYRAPDATLVLRSVSVLGDASSSLRFATGLPCGGATALASDGNRLHVLVGTPGESYSHTSTVDGNTFTALSPLPIAHGFVGTSAFTAYTGGLAVLWAENAGGRAHLLTSANGGSTWQDAVLPFAVVPEPAICADPTSENLLVGYGEWQGGSGSFQIALVDPATAAIARSVSTSTPVRPGSAAICPTNYHNRPGLHIAAQEQDTHGNGPFLARSAPATLEQVGEPEPFGPSAFGLSLVHDGTRAWVAWCEAGAGELWIAPYAAAFQLPAGLRARLGELCDPEECPADPRLVCAATDTVTWQWVSPAIHNARRGDLLMTPGDGAGLIGRLLAQLQPRQSYDHMGIMVRDHDLVRHATMAHGRLRRRDPGRYLTGEFFGKRAPVDGYRPDVLTYGWPGTITQSVDDAFFTGFNTPGPSGRPRNPQGDFFALNPDVRRLPRPADGAPQAEWDAWTDQQRFADPEFPGDETFPIHNFPRVPAYVKETGRTIDPVVVKPPPELEARDPRIRQVLHRVAAAAEAIAGHYRFFAYSDARIALDPARFGPPGDDPLWAGKPPGAAWAAGTRPVVCSSFLWAAVQLANSRHPQRIELEGTTTEDPEELLTDPPVDGLYRYLPDERANAGKALHDLLVETVRKEVYAGVQEAEHENRLAIDLATIGIGGILLLLAGPAAAAAAVLGITVENIAALKLLLEDMPDDVATQMCNTFAKDRADEIDDDLWESPGEGLAVSPDDIRAFWDAPDPNSGAEVWRGLYGRTERLLLTPWRMEPRREHRWERSDGPALVHGEVRYRGAPVEGAHVRFGCETTMTARSSDGPPGYVLALSAGRYEAVATAYWPSTQQELTGRAVVELQAGDQPGPVHLELEDPPDWRRLVRCTGKIDTVRRVLIGEDDWAHSGINDQAFLTWAPGTWGPPPGGASTTSWEPVFLGEHAQRFNVRVDVAVTLGEDLSLEVTAASALCEHYYDRTVPPAGHQIVTRREHPPVTVAPGTRRTFTFDHVSGNFPPDRGHVELTIENAVSPA
jgi:hypothetical protein